MYKQKGNLVKKIGNFLLVLALCTSFLAFAQDSIEVQIKVKTAQGLPLHEASVHKPFMLTVTILNYKGGSKDAKVFIDAHDSFEMRSQGTTAHMNSINGVSTHQVSYQYAVRAKSVGTFNLGPAAVTIDGKVYTSEVLKVHVVEEPDERITRTQPWLELIVQDDGPIVVGQTVPLILRFYHLGLSQLASVVPPEVSGFTLGTLEGPFKGSTTLDGASYDSVEWRGDMVAKAAGTFTIKPAHAVYSMKARDRMHIFQLLSDHFSIGMQQYEIDSNSLNLTVNPLPPFKGTVHGVGNFTYIQALVNQTTAKQGEGIVYTLEIGGDTALSDLTHPALLLPDTVTSYESKTSMPTNRYRNPDQQRKLFEYVMQARKPGSLTIPAQTFNFYDPKQQQYKQLTTEPITLTIEADVAAQSKSAGKNPALDQEEPAQAVEDVLDHHHLPLHAQGSMQYRIDTGLNPLWFWALLCLLLIGLVLQWSRFFWKLYAVRNHDYLRARAAFTRAHKSIAHARRERNAKELYDTFMQLYADRHGKAISGILEADVVTWLAHAQLPPETIKQWKQYITQLQTYVFYDAGQIPSADLFTAAEKWLALLEKTV